MEQMNHVIGNMKKPVIASVHGFAVANGAGLMAAADLAVVAEGTKIGTTAINVGLFCNEIRRSLWPGISARNVASKCCSTAI